MGVRIDAARHDVAAAGVNDFGAGRRLQVFADGDDRAVIDQDVGTPRVVVIDDGAAANKLRHAGLPPYAIANGWPEPVVLSGCEQFVKVPVRQPLPPSHWGVVCDRLFTAGYWCG